MSGSGRARRLIVNADDLGRTPGVNAGIFEAHRRGIVTSATLMVGFPAAEAAARALPEHPRLGVGLHVTLTGAAPTLPAVAVPSLVDGRGRFPAKPEDLSASEPAEIAAEARRQLELFRELTGRMPTHLDSHHHSHRHPLVLAAIVELAREHALPVRSSSPEVGRRLRAAGVATTDRFVERFFGAGVRVDVLVEILAALEPGTTELMCHPARIDDELRASSSYVDARERELAVLTDPVVRERIDALGIELVDFGSLHGS
ncbi:MAG TPA: carbohydrate deacetylase [Thermoanaerobaculia bacterium]|nr:carbohydrate deacetylase [Thermoanaerobaculia bacterium]